MLRRDAGVHLDRTNTAREQQTGELGDLCVARQQMLSMPHQSRRSDLPFDGSEPSEAGQRGRDLPHRLEYRGMRWRIETRQAERGSDGAQRAVDGSSVYRHG